MWKAFYLEIAAPCCPAEPLLAVVGQASLDRGEASRSCRMEAEFERDRAQFIVATT